jgi:Uma2 family endonuclease
MSEDAARRGHATWEDYDHLPEDVRREYIDAEIVVTPFPSARHSLTIYRLQAMLVAALPDSLITVSHLGRQGVGANEFGANGCRPDVMVLPLLVPTTSGSRAIPPLVVEVVSTNPAADTVTKLQRYAAAGAPGTGPSTCATGPCSPSSSATASTRSPPNSTATTR